MKSLNFQLTKWYFFILNIFVICIFSISYFSLQALLTEKMDQDLLEDVQEYTALFKTKGMEALVTEINRETAGGSAEKVFIQILDKNGEILHSSSMEHWPGMKPDPKQYSQISKGHKPYILNSTRLPEREYSGRIIYSAMSENILHIGETTEEQEDILDMFLSVAILIVFGVIPISALAGWWIAKKAVRGINAVRLAAQGIEQGDLNSTVEVEAQTEEIQNLVSSFNAMAARIRKLILEIREMNDNIAHDLRSPLTRIRALCEEVVSGDDKGAKHLAEDILLECDRLIHLINTTLDVAEVEAKVGYTETDRIDIGRLVEEAFDLFQPVAEERKIGFKLDNQVHCDLNGNRHNLQRMLSNIIDNAIKYTSENGHVQLNTVKSDQSVYISVIDDGIGIPESDHARVFERFFRCDQSRSQEGFGLGLSFAQAVAKSHGGKIQVRSRPGVYSEFTIDLPIEDANLTNS